MTGRTYPAISGCRVPGVYPPGWPNLGGLRRSSPICRRRPRDPGVGRLFPARNASGRRLGGGQLWGPPGRQRALGLQNGVAAGGRRVLSPRADAATGWCSHVLGIPLGCTSRSAQLTGAVPGLGVRRFGTGRGARARDGPDGLLDRLGQQRHHLPLTLDVGVSGPRRLAHRQAVRSIGGEVRTLDAWHAEAIPWRRFCGDGCQRRLGRSQLPDDDHRHGRSATSLVGSRRLDPVLYLSSMGDR